MIMKKLFTTALLACFAWNGIHSQLLTNEEPELRIPDRNYQNPTLFVDAPLLYTYDFVNEDCIVHFYNEDLTQSRDITLKGIKYIANDYGDMILTKGKDGYFHQVAYIAYIDFDNKQTLTQYLFNQDEKFEYIEVTHKENQHGFLDHENIIKIEVKNEDGDLIGTLPKECLYCSDNLFVKIRPIGSSYFIICENRENNNLNFWKLNLPKEGSGISASKVKSLNGYPNPVKKNEYFHIDLDSKLIGNAHIEVWDAKGNLTYKIPVTSNITKIPTTNLNGMYIYKVTDSTNKENKTGKFIVQ